MGKNKKNNNREVVALTTPTVYSVDFKDIPLDQYTQALNVLFSTPEFAEALAKRNKLVNSSKQMKAGSAELINLIRIVQKHDRFLADWLYNTLVQLNVHSTQIREDYSLNVLFRYHVDYNKEGMKEKVEKLSASLNKLTFLADMLESLLIDINHDMTAVFGDKFHFEQFNAVNDVMKQVQGFFGQVRSEDVDTPSAKLYLEYADSIDAYLYKRLKTYSEKYRKLFPMAVGHSSMEMVEALNQFFGTEKKFDRCYIKKNEDGGRYIDANRLIFNLDSEQTRKLDKAVGDVAKFNNDFTKYSYAVTDVIMANYKKPTFAPSK